MIRFTPLLLLGCAPDLAFEEEDPIGEEEDTDTQEEIVEEDEEGTRSTGIDATDYEVWHHFDLETGEVVSADDERWDIAIQRFQIKLNGGVSGDGNVDAAPIEDVSYEDVTAAPESGYVTDEPDADEDGNPEYALGGWYNYDVSTHILTPAAVVYVIRSVEANPHRFEVLDYYDDAGTSGHMSFRWTPITSP